MEKYLIFIIIVLLLFIFYKQLYKTRHNITSCDKNINIFNNKYKKISLINKSDFSEVYIYEDINKTKVCVKKIKFKPIRLLEHKEIQYSLPDIFDINRHINILKKLSYLDDYKKYVRKFIDYYIDNKNNYVYIILEYLYGFTLDKLFGSELSSMSIIKIAKDICESLKYIHTNNITHGDLIMSNIFYDITNDRFKIIDFNFSSDSSDYKLNGYSSPETLFSYHRMKNIDRRLSPLNWHNTRRFKADIWSLGLIIYALYTKKHLNNDIRVNKELYDIVGINNEYSYKNGDKLYLPRSDDKEVDLEIIKDQKIKKILKKTLVIDWIYRYDCYELLDLIEKI